MLQPTIEKLHALRLGAMADALTALLTMAREGGVGNHRVPLILSGSSAGAGLAAALAVLSAQEHIPVDGVV